MEMLNKAIDGADVFKKMIEQVSNAPAKSAETRRERRVRERAEKKAALRAARKVAA